MGSKRCTWDVLAISIGSDSLCLGSSPSPICAWGRSQCNASSGGIFWVDPRLRYYNCLSCMGGMKFKNTTDNPTRYPECEECPANSYRVEGTPNTCLPCPVSLPKSATRSPGVSACQLPCSRGTTNSSSGSCIQCGKGTYKDTVADSVCKMCPLGKFSSQLGRSDNCDACPSNSMSLPGSDEEGDCNCQAGFAINVDLSCTPCAKGTYRDQDALPSAACSSCPGGKFSDASQLQSVHDCKTCPSNSDSLLGSDAVTDCMCKAGFTKGADSICRACDPGSWKSGAGDGACTSCGPLRTSLQSGNTLQSSCVCIDKHADNGASDGQCVLCGDGTYRNTLNNGVGSQCVACPQQYSANALTQLHLTLTAGHCIEFV